MSRCNECGHTGMCADWCGADPSELQEKIEELSSELFDKEQTIESLNKKLSGVQTARQYELDKSKRYKRALDKIAEYEMYPYSKEVIDIKNLVIDAFDIKNIVLDAFSGDER